MDTDLQPVGGRGSLRSGAAAGAAFLALLLGPAALPAATPGATPDFDGSGRTLLLRRWSTAEGLPQSSVLDIAPDQEGHLWLATFAGLARFDGSGFLVLDVAALPELPSNQITALVPAGDGAFWLATLGDGVVRLAAGRVDRALPPARTDAEVIALAQDGAGGLWLRETNGALRRWQGDRWDEVLAPGTPASKQSLYRDGEGSIWASDGRRLLRFAPSGALTGTWTAAAPVLALAGGAGEGSPPWLGLANGVARLTPGGIEPLRIEPRLAAPVVALLGDGPDALFAATADGELRRLSRSTGDSWSPGPVLAQLGTGSTWRVLARDPGGELWIGTDGEGLLRLQVAKVAVLGLEGRTAPATALISDGAGGAWAAFGCDGLGRAAGPAGPFVPLALPPPASGDECLHSLLRDARGRLWVGRRDELLRRAPGGGDFAVVLRFTGDAGPLVEGPGGTWIGTRAGRVVRLDDRDRVAEQLDLGSPVSGLTVGGDGALWVGLQGALVRHEGDHTRRWDSADGIRAGAVRDVLPRPDGKVWIASYGGGLGLLSAGRIAWVTRDQGLPDNGVTRILPDPEGRLWLLTNRGLAVAAEGQLVAVAEGRRPTVDFVVYGPEAGMPEGNYGHPAGFRSDDGRIWVDTIKGVATMDAAGFPFRHRVPTASIDRLLADGRQLARGDPTVVPAGTSHLEVDFSVAEIDAPEGVRVRYRLAGFDQEWAQPSVQRRATYSRLPPGSFRFELLVRNADGVWAKTPTALRLRVLPAWWQTWIARIAFALGALVAAAAFHLTRTRAIRRRGAVLLRESEARRAAEERASLLRGELEHLQRVATASQLTAALAHEINQPLSAIVANAAAGARLVDHEQPRGDELAAILGDIAAQGRRTSQVIGGLRRLMKKGEPVGRPLDANEVVADALLLARGELARQGIEVALDLAPDLPPVVADRVQLQQVLINLISNAGEALASWAGTRRLTLGTAREEEGIRIDVVDTGPGLAAAVEAQVFAPFVTTKPEGMGMGLPICKAAIEANGGWIEHLRPDGGGALFRLHLPAGGRELEPS